MIRKAALFCVLAALPSAASAGAVARAGSATPGSGGVWNAVGMAVTGAAHIPGYLGFSGAMRGLMTSSLYVGPTIDIVNSMPLTQAVRQAKAGLPKALRTQVARVRDYAAARIAGPSPAAKAPPMEASKPSAGVKAEEGPGDASPAKVIRIRRPSGRRSFASIEKPGSLRGLGSGKLKLPKLSDAAPSEGALSKLFDGK